MTRNRLHALTSWITTAVLNHPDDLVPALMAHAGVRRATALKLLRQLGAAGWLLRQRRGRSYRYSPGPMREVVRRYEIAGLDEDSPWRRDFVRAFNLTEGVLPMVRHAFSELVNNAIDHSGGTEVVVSLRQTATQVQLLVSDNGRGLFDSLATAFGFDDHQHAMLELSKGRLTSDPARHTGRGLFYTLRLADVALLHANASAFQQRQWEGAQWRSGRPMPRVGTSVYLAITLDTPRRLDDVLRSASLDANDYALERVTLPLALIADDGGLVSRAAARRVGARLQGLRHVEVDFSGVSALGHSFADELFRVSRPGGAGLGFSTVGMAEPLVAMLRSVLPASGADVHAA